MSEEAPTSDLLDLPARLVAALRNAVEIAQLGRRERIAHTPYELAMNEANFRLRRYGLADDVDSETGAAAERDAAAPHRRAAQARPSIILIPPLMLTADVYDVAPETSAVSHLAASDIDPWVVDFGAPERQEGGLQRTLTDHIVAVSEAVDYVRGQTGRNVHLAGYSQGGIFAYLVAAYRYSEGLASVITFGSPVNVHQGLVPGVPDELVLGLVKPLGRLVTAGLPSGAVPAWLSRNAFKMLSPTKELRHQLEFLGSLHDRDALMRREGARRFLSDEGWVAWPGPAFSDFLEQMVMGNRLFSGGFVVEGRTVTLADMTCPVLAFVGENDDIAKARTVRSLADVALRAKLYETSLRAGHMGLVIGSLAMRETWPTVTGWIQWQEGAGEKPARVVPLGSRIAESRGVADAAAGNGAGRMAESEEEQEGGAESEELPSLLSAAGSLGLDALHLLADIVGSGAEAFWTLGTNVASQVPRLARLEALRRDTRVGLALTLAEQAAASPTSTFFLYEGRAHTYADADRRVDAIVRGLLSLGVRTGDNVGVLMNSRPSALAVVAAVNRLGAVSVMLRGDDHLPQEIRLADVDHMVADPNHAEAALAAFHGRVHVLGGVGNPDRELPAGANDMEAIDPDLVAVPQWYRPSPGKAEDVAFVFFSGHGAGLHANRITNRRWALSALGTASAVAMSPSDTVYGWTPIQHPTGLLVSMSAALAAGSRVALAHGFGAETFWEDVRRYGATVVFYTGAVLRELIDAPRRPSEHNHSVRMFAGSGMPAPLWRRLLERFEPTNVLEFYASTEGSAILANVSGRKIGALGRPIPGSAEVCLAAWDVEADRPVLDDAGYVWRAARGASGMLLARVERERGALEGRPMRNVFEAGDAWHVTGNICRIDEEGDYWLVDRVADMIRSGRGTIPSRPIEEALWELDSVSEVAAYALELSPSVDVPAAALVLRGSGGLDVAELSRKAGELPVRSRPVIIRVLRELPRTPGYRVLKGPLRSHGIPAEDIEQGRVLWLDPASGAYQTLDQATLATLRG
ncbi:MAG: AMP-binding protein [Deltaproteobacteria bacterium]|nr:AMP-binding protein [Deltaproteobacteria bacterium]